MLKRGLKARKIDTFRFRKVMETMLSSTVSDDNSNDGHLTGWQALTIREILEKVDLFNITTMADERKEIKKETFGVSQYAGLVSMPTKSTVGSFRYLATFPQSLHFLALACGIRLLACL